MAISDEVALVLKGQNVATPAIEEALKSLRSLRSLIISTTKELAAYNTEAERMATITRGLIGPQNDLRLNVNTTTLAIREQAAAMRDLGASARSAAGANPAAAVGSGSTEEARRRGGGMLSGLGQNLVQGLAFGGLYGAYSAVSGGVSQALQFNATSASTAATTGISAGGLKQITDGILQIAGSGNSRYDANTLLQGAYSIISTGVTNPQAVLSTLRAATASATAANATDIAPNTSALTTVLNAYGSHNLARDAMKYQDIITMAINQGKADPSQIPMAVATYAKSARAAGASFAEASGLFAFDTLTAPTGQQAGQDTKAFFDAINNPNGQQRKIAQLLGLDIGSGSLKRAGGVQNLITSYLGGTAGANQGLFLERLLGNKDAVSLVQGAAADPSKLQTYLANASGTGTTLSGADKFLASDAGKLYSATNELKTEFQKFSAQAIPLLTSALSALTLGMKDVSGLGAGLGQIGNFLNPPKSPSEEAYAASQMQVFTAKQASLYGPSGAFPSGPRGPEAQAYQLYRNQQIIAGKTAISPQAWAATHKPGPDFFDQLGSGVSNVLSGGQGTGDLFNFGSMADALRNALGIDGDKTVGGGAPAGVTGYRLRGSASGGLAQPAGGGGNTFGMGGQLAGALSGLTGGVQTQLQAGALSYASRLPNVRKSPDMTSAQNALTLALGTGQSQSVINQALSAYISAVNASSVDASTKALDIHQAQAAVAAYTQNLTQQAAATAQVAVQSGYTQVQERLQIAQMTGKGVAGATSADLAYLRAHPSLYNNDPLQLKIMELSLQQQTGTGALPKAATEHLLRPTLPQDQLSASFGASVSRLTGGPDQARNDTIRELQKENASLREQLAVLKGVEKSGKKTADTNEIVARGVLALVAQGSKPAARNGMNSHGVRK